MLRSIKQFHKRFDFGSDVTLIRVDGAIVSQFLRPSLMLGIAILANVGPSQLFIGNIFYLCCT